MRNKVSNVKNSPLPRWERGGGEGESSIYAPSPYPSPTRGEGTFCDTPIGYFERMSAMQQSDEPDFSKRKEIVL